MSSKESPVAAESAKLMEGKNNDGFPEEDKRSLCSRLCSACCSRCCRLLLAFILFPFVIVMTLLAVIVWLLLLPFRLCSSCLAPAIDWVVKVLTIPSRGFRWAMGGSFKDDKL